MRIVIYEDKHENFQPLINFYPQFNLRIGTGTILDNFQHYFQKFKFDYISRDIFNFKFPSTQGPIMYLSSRLLLKEKLHMPKEEVKFTVDSEVIGFLKITPPLPKNFTEIDNVVKGIKKTKEVSGIVLNNLTDLIKYNEQILLDHFKMSRALLQKGRTNSVKTKFIKNIEIIGKKSNLFVARNVVIHKFVTIDVSEGPVYIDRKAIIRPFTTIIGPTYIGEGTILDRAKIIKSGIGPCSRLGGEVDACIFQGYSNKYHEGFIGHSFIGEWVNLGALTTNSDLKNNYSVVRIKTGEKIFNSEMIKLGCFIGDHAKLGIGTLIPTGAVIGSFVNFFSGGMMPRFIPSFKWFGPGIIQDYDLEKAITTARIVMERRGIKMSKEYEALIRANYKSEKSK